MKEKVLDFFTGLIIVVIGIALFGQSLGFWNFKLFAGWWTLFLIVPSAFNIFKSGFKVLNSITLFIGISLLLKAQGIFKNINSGLLLFSLLLMVIGSNKVYKLVKRKNNIKELK